MRRKSEFEKFDDVMGGLLAVPYSELQQKLAEEKKAKAKKKKRPTSTASRVAASGKKRAA
ncbi:MAG TPA: hypothetical protein VFZ40_12930 [Pyrinomonadaceae bacterium]